MPCVGDLGRPERRQHAVVDRVVEEQHLGRLDDDRREREQAVVDQRLDPVAESVGDPADDRLDHRVAEDGHDAAEDADAEVVDQHLEAGLDLAGDQVVEQLQQVGRQRAEDEGTQDHDLAAEGQRRGPVVEPDRVGSGDDRAERRDRADDGTALAVHHPATGVRHQGRDQHDDHRADHLGQVRVGCPAVRDEEGGDEPEGDERPDVGHHHAREVAAEALDAGASAAALRGRAQCVWHRHGFRPFPQPRRLGVAPLTSAFLCISARLCGRQE